MLAFGNLDVLSELRRASGVEYEIDEKSSNQASRRDGLTRAWQAGSFECGWAMNIRYSFRWARACYSAGRCKQKRRFSVAGQHWQTSQKCKLSGHTNYASRWLQDKEQLVLDGAIHVALTECFCFFLCLDYASTACSNSCARFHKRQ